MYTVVVADDEEELRKALIRKVDWKKVGFEVVGEAENGIEALELVEKFEPDLLLTDIKMPYITGIELARQVREVRPTTQIAFLSGYDDFSYAQQAIQYNIISYLLKPISSAEITEELNKIRIKIDERFQEFANQNVGHMEISEFLMPLVMDGGQGEIDEEQEQRILNEAVNCGLLKDKNNDFRYTIMVTSISNQEENCTMTSTVNAIDMILRKYVRHSSFYANGKVVSLLLATTAGYEKYLHILVEDISQSMKRILNKNCAIGVSRQMPKISMLHEAYLEAMNALGYSRRNGSGVHFISDVETSESLELESIQGYLGEIEGLLRCSSKEDLIACIGRIFQQIEKEQIPPVAVNFLLSQLVSVVLRIVYAVSEGEGITQLQKLIPPQDKFQMKKIASVRRSYEDFCLGARELITEQRKKSSTVICERALELIEKKYMDPELSLVAVSNEISVSPNYLSALVKKSTGSNFVDLLTKQRITKAKELLLCSNMKIREISELCGYNDQHYFSYCFKKFTGVSPNSMRRDD